MIKILLIMISSFLVLSCVTIGVILVGMKKLDVTIQHPAELNLSEYHSIAIGDIVSNKGIITNVAYDLRIQITDALKREEDFEIIDRKEISEILYDYGFDSKIVIDNPDIVYKLRKHINADLFIIGKVTEYSCDNWQKKLGKYWTCKEYCELNVNLKLIDIKKGVVIEDKKFRYFRKVFDEYNHITSGPDSKKKLTSKAVKNIRNKFLKLFIPYKKTYFYQDFYVSKQLPELDQGINSIEMGNNEQALLFFEKATQRKGINSKIKSKAFFNLGKLQKLMLEYDKSKINLEKAKELKDSKY